MSFWIDSLREISFATYFSVDYATERWRACFIVDQCFAIWSICLSAYSFSVTTSGKTVFCVSLFLIALFMFLLVSIFKRLIYSASLFLFCEYILSRKTKKVSDFSHAEKKFFTRVFYVFQGECFVRFFTGVFYLLFRKSFKCFLERVFLKVYNIRVCSQCEDIINILNRTAKVL